MRRWWYLIAGVAAIGGLIGLYLLVSFLVGLTLDDADKWMSVVGGLTAVSLPIVALVMWLTRKGRAVVDVLPAQDPSRWGSIRRSYLQTLRQRYQHLDLEVLTPLSEQDDQPTLRLVDVFVGQQVKNDPPALEVPRELLLRLMEGESAGSRLADRELLPGDPVGGGGYPAGVEKAKGHIAIDGLPQGADGGHRFDGGPGGSLIGADPPVDAVRDGHPAVGQDYGFSRHRDAAAA